MEYNKLALSTLKDMIETLPLDGVRLSLAGMLSFWGLMSAIKDSDSDPSNRRALRYVNDNEYGLLFNTYKNEDDEIAFFIRPIPPADFSFYHDIELPKDFHDTLTESGQYYTNLWIRNLKGLSFIFYTRVIAICDLFHNEMLSSIRDELNPVQETVMNSIHDNGADIWIRDAVIDQTMMETIEEIFQVILMKSK